MTEENKIVDNELAKLGFETKKEQPPQVIAPSPVSNPIKPKRIVQKSPDLFGVPDIPEFLDRRKTKVEPDVRGKDWKPTPVVQSSYCTALTDRLNEVRVRVQHNKGSANAVIETSDLDIIVNNLHEQLGNMMEHAGFIYMSGDASLRLKDYLRMYLLTNCKVYNGAMYRYPLENVKRNAKAD